MSCEQPSELCWSAQADIEYERWQDEGFLLWTEWEHQTQKWCQAITDWIANDYKGEPPEKPDQILILEYNLAKRYPENWIDTKNKALLEIPEYANLAGSAGNPDAHTRLLHKLVEGNIQQ